MRVFTLLLRYSGNDFIGLVNRFTYSCWASKSKIYTEKTDKYVHNRIRSKLKKNNYWLKRFLHFRQNVDDIFSKFYLFLVSPAIIFNCFGTKILLLERNGNFLFHDVLSRSYCDGSYDVNIFWPSTWTSWNGKILVTWFEPLILIITVVWCKCLKSCH